MKLERASSFLTRCMLAIFLAMMLCAIVLGLTLGHAFCVFMVCGAIIVAVCFLILPKLAAWLARLGPIRAAVLLAVLCLLVKGLWVAFVHPEPQGDSITFWITAGTLSTDEPFEAYRIVYTSLFPHVFGYSSFLGLAFRIFGIDLAVGLWVNVVLSACAGLLLFELGRLWIGLEAGISAFVIWIIFPNQMVYNSIILADLFYSTLLLAFLVVVTRVYCLISAPAEDAKKGWGTVFLWAGIGAVACAVLLRLINASRPIAAVPMIALLLWALLLRGRQLAEWRLWRTLLPFLVLTVGIYAATGPLWDAYFTRRVGAEPSSIPGYNIYVGFNEETGGLHNQEDSDLLFEYALSPGATSKWAQEQMLEEAKARITSGQIDFLGLMLRKLRTFLSFDCPAGYVSSVLPDNRRLSDLCYICYDALLLLALLGGVSLWRRKEKSTALILPMYALGLTMAQMLVEVAMRYHYSLMPVFILIGQFALFGGRKQQTAPAGIECQSMTGCFGEDTFRPTQQTADTRRPQSMADTLYIVVPCYNEEAVLPETARRLGDKLSALTAAGKISEKSRVMFVNDGSKDRTWELIRELHQKDSRFLGADLSRNRGHQNALLAGLMTAKDRCDMAISMDADLQDDIDAVDAMLEQYGRGCEVVYGVRSSRKKDTFFKRFTAEAFYRLMNAMGAETVFNHADYRLMSRRALEGLAEFKEVNLFLRGIVPLVGYTAGTVEYERGERFAGESKYPLKKMLAFALEGITSLSTKPIRMVTGLGFLIFLVSIAMLIYSIVRWATGAAIIGWASVICSVWAIGGLILLSLGVIGEYIGKIYLETKQRPRFLIRELLEDAEDENT